MTGHLHEVVAGFIRVLIGQGGEAPQPAFFVNRQGELVITGADIIARTGGILLPRHNANAHDIHDRCAVVIRAPALGDNVIMQKLTKFDLHMITHLQILSRDRIAINRVSVQRGRAHVIYDGDAPIVVVLSVRAAAEVEETHIGCCGGLKLLQSKLSGYLKGNSFTALGHRICDHNRSRAIFPIHFEVVVVRLKIVFSSMTISRPIAPPGDQSRVRQLQNGSLKRSTFIEKRNHSWVFDYGSTAPSTGVSV